MYKSRKGQGWSMDYVLSLLLFILVAFIAVKMLTNAFPSSYYPVDEAKRISNHLVSEGSPALWNPGDVDRLGLTNGGNRINEAKLRNFLELNYSTTKQLFGVWEDYAFYFQKDGNVSSVGSQCALGSVELGEDKNVTREYRPAAYYYRDDSLLLGWMGTVGADVYDANTPGETDDFYSALDGYEIVVMENPKLGDLSEVVEKEALSGFVKNGGLIFLTGNVSFNLTGIGFGNATGPDASITNDEDEYLDVTNGVVIEDDDLADPVIGVKNINASSFTEIAAFNTSGTYAARWNYGIGKGYYFSEVDATYKSLGVGMNDKIGKAVENAANVTKADCFSLDTDSLDTDNIARVERFVIRDGDIMSMVVLSWT